MKAMTSMQWKSLFTSNPDITVKQTKEYLAVQPPDTFQLLDVRQPKEYQEQHLPGAILIPLGDLPNRLIDLRQDQKTIVYCRSGMRSKAACQILLDGHFDDVVNMAGGILKWKGSTASGNETIGLEYFVGGTFSSGFAMAYQMEKGLQQFYILLQDRVQSPDVRSLLEMLAKYENGHMAKLLAKHRQHSKQVAELPSQTVLEGGFKLDDLPETFGEHLQTEESIFQMAMTFEAQAFDLYQRLARQTSEQEQKTFYQQMAEEEQKHLNQLANKLDELIT